MPNLENVTLWPDDAPTNGFNNNAFDLKPIGNGNMTPQELSFLDNESTPKDISIYDENDKLKKTAMTYSRNPSEMQDNHLLTIMVG